MAKRERLQGELESAILSALWDSPECLTSHQVREAINSTAGGDVALTTVLTVLSRLIYKGHVERHDGEGRAFLFGATKSREAHTANLMLDIFAAADSPALALSHFTSGLTEAQLKQLRQSLGE